jgi:hypothetical protein
LGYEPNELPDCSTPQNYPNARTPIGQWGETAAAARAKMDLGYALPMKRDVPNYELALTTLKAKFYPSGLLGAGLTGLMASFMSGMAGNVTAFNENCLKVARISTVAGVAEPGRREVV